MLISSFTSQNGTLITPLLLFYLQLGLICTKIQHRFVEYTRKRSFDIVVQAAVDARRNGDENPNSGVVVETMKLLAKSSYGYQIMDRSRHTVTKYLPLNSPKHRLNTKSQSLTASSFLNMQNCECWSCTTTSSPGFGM